MKENPIGIVSEENKHGSVTLPDLSVAVVRAGEPFWKISVSEIWRYRYMLMYSIHRDIVILYKQTVLGPAWLVLQPFFMSFLFSIVFGRIAGIQTDGVPGFLFYFSNNIFWGFIATTHAQISSIFITGKTIMGRVYFPRFITPLATLGGGLFRLAIQVVFLFALFIYYFTKGEISLPNGWLLFWLLPAVLQMCMVSVGTGFLLACITVKYRDLSVVGNLFVQGWMYLSPIAYPLSQVPESYVRWIAFNPVTSAIEMSRHAIYGTDLPGLSIILTGWAVTLAIFLTGIFTFNVVQRRFIDVV